MSQSQARFDTPLVTTWGLWPEPRAYWSYSSLKDIETCPLRWMLSRADYPDLWSGPGYPPAPAVAALFGDIVHTALETIVERLQAAGCTSPQSAAAAEVLRNLGGLTHVIDQVFTEHMTRLVANPRLGPDRTAAVRRALAERVPEARARVQSILSRTDLPPGRTIGSPTTPDAPASPVDRPTALERGAYPEVALTAADLRLAGRIDLLTVSEDQVRITDYKTGNEDPGHLDQLRTYALLWARDSTANPDRRLATELLVEYPTHHIRVTAPDTDELRALETELAERIVVADDLVGNPPPPAKPDPEVCRFCAVRQMCDDYWQTIVPDPRQVPIGDWFDVEGTIAENLGARSWLLTTRGSESMIVLRTPDPREDIRVGDRLRVLGVRRDEEPDSESAEAVMTVSSELYLVTSSGTDQP